MTLQEQDPGPHRGCACPSDDARLCISIRYGNDGGVERCTCNCHEWDDDWQWSDAEHAEGELK